MDRFYVSMKERTCVDTQELAAMLGHRLNALEYHQKLLGDGKASFAFGLGEDCDETIVLFRVGSHDELDWLIKRDPHFPYTKTIVTPVITTEALVREAQDYLGEEIFAKDQIPQLNFPEKAINRDGEYWLAWKEVPPFSPLCSEETQNDVHRRTVLAQRGHFAELEFADYNPAGRPIGILVSEGPLDAIRHHVETCEVFPDTVVTYTRLWTHKQAWARTAAKLVELRRTAPEANPFV
jgi:hypothetical protein